MTKPGWYSDPDDDSQFRWWTGTIWGPKAAKANGLPEPLEQAPAETKKQPSPTELGARIMAGGCGLMVLGLAMTLFAAIVFIFLF